MKASSKDEIEPDNEVDQTISRHDTWCIFLARSNRVVHICMFVITYVIRQEMEPLF